MKDFSIDDAAYECLLDMLNNQHFTEKVGIEKDMDFLSDDSWLRDTAVIERVVKRNGMWEIHLVFAHYQQPDKLIKRVISQHPIKEKALLHAHYMCRLAAKDQRGTLQVKIEDFNLNLS